MRARERVRLVRRMFKDVIEDVSLERYSLKVVAYAGRPGVYHFRVLDREAQEGILSLHWDKDPQLRYTVVGYTVDGPGSEAIRTLLKHLNDRVIRWSRRVP